MLRIVVFIRFVKRGVLTSVTGLAVNSMSLVLVGVVLRVPCSPKAGIG